MSVELLSHLSYAEQNARLDALRKVLACPAEGCFARAPWTDVAAATVLGWSFEDRIVDGKVVRVWLCPEHRPKDQFPPLPSKAAMRAKLGDGLDLKGLKLIPFADMAVVLIRLGQDAGTQVAIVLYQTPAFSRVMGWVCSSQRWVGPKIVPAAKVIGAPSPNDRRLKAMAKAWPPSK